MYNLKQEPFYNPLTSSTVHILLKSKSCLDKLGNRISEGKNLSNAHYIQIEIVLLLNAFNK